MSRLRRLLAALGLLALGAGGRAFAGSTAAIDVDVTISASLSVEVDGVASSTYTAVWDASVPNQKLASVSSATVVNDSGGLTERWSLSTLPQTGNTTGGADSWSLAASTRSVGADQVGVQAVFGSSRTAAGGCPLPAASDWDQSYAPPLTASPVGYTSSVFADAALNDHGTPAPDLTVGAADGRMHAGSRRALCWRLVMPASTSTTQTQNVQITITAGLP